MKSNLLSAAGTMSFRVSVIAFLLLSTTLGASTRPSNYWNNRKHDRQANSHVEEKKGEKKTEKKSSSIRSSTVRTTAYTHNEKDHHKYGRKNAIGTTLKYGKVRSAAADWSVFPLGTKFRIADDPNLYVIDDYGSALIGTRTIDIYKPSRRAMNAWGVRHVKIRIVEKGSVERSLHYLRERTRYRHVREMVKNLKAKTRG